MKLRRATTEKMFASFFVSSNEQANISGIPDGDYRIQYAFGDQLDVDCKSFVGLSGAGQFPEVERMVTTEEEVASGTMIQRAHVTYTLYATPSGTVQPATINADQFNAE